MGLFGGFKGKLIARRRPPKEKNDRGEAVCVSYKFFSEFDTQVAGELPSSSTRPPRERRKWTDRPGVNNNFTVKIPPETSRLQARKLPTPPLPSPRRLPPPPPPPPKAPPRAPPRRIEPTLELQKSTDQMPDVQKSTDPLSNLQKSTDQLPEPQKSTDLPQDSHEPTDLPREPHESTELPKTLHRQTDGPEPEPESVEDASMTRDTPDLALQLNGEDSDDGSYTIHFNRNVRVTFEDSSDEESWNGSEQLESPPVNYSSQAASIFFGDAVEPVVTRPRRILVEEVDSVSNGSSASA